MIPLEDLVPSSSERSWLEKNEYWRQRRTPKEFKFEEHPYYAEWKYDFLLEGCQNSKIDCNGCNGHTVVAMCICKFVQLVIVREWLKENNKGPTFMVGQRVSMMNDTDAVNFRLRWC